jgi:2,3-bisphosphoglycerate-independent phosphoglycerate mutase
MDDRFNPLVIVILDGFGLAPSNDTLDLMPFISWAFNQYGYQTLDASGTTVGLLPNMPGNSYVGHLTIGAGRSIQQPVVHIQELIESGQWYKLSYWHELMAQDPSSTLHILGMCSPTGTHGLTAHTVATLRALAQARHMHVQYPRIALHLIADGRDTYAREFLQEYTHIHNVLEEVREDGLICTLASLAGRAYAMPRIMQTTPAQTYLQLFRPEYPISTLTVQDVVQAAYAAGLSDEYIPPTKWSNLATMHDKDSILCTQLRPERVSPWLAAMHKEYNDLNVVGMISYAPDHPNLAIIPLQHSTSALLRDIIQKGYQVLLVAESEKEAHITHFLCGDSYESLSGVDTTIIPSDHSVPFEQQPAMQAWPITHAILQGVYEKQHEVIIANYANADMIGHTGDKIAMTETLHILDEVLRMLYQYVVSDRQGALVITADHGNIEQKHDSSWHGHSTNPVPFCILYQQGSAPFYIPPMKDIADIATCVVSLLDLMHIHRQR